MIYQLSTTQVVAYVLSGVVDTARHWLQECDNIEHDMGDPRATPCSHTHPEEDAEPEGQKRSGNRSHLFSPEPFLSPLPSGSSSGLGDDGPEFPFSTRSRPATPCDQDHDQSHRHAASASPSHRYR